VIVKPLGPGRASAPARRSVLALQHVTATPVNDTTLLASTVRYDQATGSLPRGTEGLWHRTRQGNRSARGVFDREASGRRFARVCRPLRNRDGGIE